MNNIRLLLYIVLIRIRWLLCFYCSQRAGSQRAGARAAMKKP